MEMGLKVQDFSFSCHDIPVFCFEIGQKEFTLFFISLYLLSFHLKHINNLN